MNLALAQVALFGYFPARERRSASQDAILLAYGGQIVMRVKYFTCAIVASGALLFNSTSAPAMASPSVTDQTVTVSVADVNLATERGADEAHRRVLNVVKAACEPRSPIWGYRLGNERRCQNSAMREADQRIRSLAAQRLTLARAK